MKQAALVGLVSTSLMGCALSTNLHAASEATAPPAASAESSSDVVQPDPAVAAFDQKDVSLMNQQIEVALERESMWVKDPLAIVLTLQSVYDISPEGVWSAGTINIDKQTDSVEVPLKAVVTVKQSGLMDDSVSATWDQYHLERGAENQPWGVTEIRHAWRCLRGETAGASAQFDNKLCS